MILHLLRHTKTACNDGICYGFADVELANTFTQDLKTVQQKISGITFSRIYSSPLKRCAMLAQSLNCNGQVIYDDRLKELNFGRWENKSWDEISQTPEAVAWFDDFINIPCPQGESYSMLRNRAETFLNDVTKRHSLDSALVVTHGGTIRAMISLLTDISPKDTFQSKIDYGQLLTFVV